MNIFFAIQKENEEMSKSKLCDPKFSQKRLLLEIFRSVHITLSNPLRMQLYLVRVDTYALSGRTFGNQDQFNYETIEVEMRMLR